MKPIRRMAKSPKRGRSPLPGAWGCGKPVVWVAGPKCPVSRVAVETAREHPVYAQSAFVSVPYRPTTAEGIRLNLAGWDGPMVYILPEQEDPEITGLILLCALRRHVVVACETRIGAADGLRAAAWLRGVRVEPFLLR